MLGARNVLVLASWNGVVAVVHRSWWRRYLAVGIVVVAGYPLVPKGIWQDVVYLILGASSVAAIVLGVHFHRPVRSAPWFMMALGQLLWVIGDGIDSWHEDIAGTYHFPSAADAFYLAAYPVLAAGLLLLIRGRRPRRDVAGVLDSATVTVGLGLLSWILLAEPTLRAGQQSYAGAAVAVAYPIADILLVGLLIRLLTTPGGRTPALRFLLFAVGLLIAGDTISAALSLFSSSSTNAYDVIWLGSYVAWGTAGLHPSMFSLSEPTGAGDATFTRSRLVALTMATLIAPATLAVEKIAQIRLDIWPVVIGSVVMFVLVVARMSAAIKEIVATNLVREELQNALAYQAAHDSLTSLPNRPEALRLINGALHRARRTGSMIALLFIDLDGFKAVNDALGHRAGDDVLRSVAQRMQEQVRGGDVVARLGGDEFVVLLEPIDTESSALPIAGRIIDAVAAPITTSDGHEVKVGASIGVAISQDASVDADRLLHEADTAAYRAKAAGRGRTEVFDTALRSELTEQALLTAAIEVAINDGELVLHYQPVIELLTGRIQGFEALIRWQRPGVGLVPPAAFVPVAEASNLILDLDNWALDHATQQLSQWNSGGAQSRELTMAVKISGRHMSHPRIVDDVAAALNRSGVSPGHLVLEITETVLMDERVGALHLKQLRDLGVRIGIDHFGSGYHSIASLQYLPVDVIKIDKRFLNPTYPTSLRLLHLLIQAAHAFDIPVIAEGVEHQYQIQDLITFECEAAQGYHLARPMTATEARQFVDQTDTVFDRG